VSDTCHDCGDEACPLMGTYKDACERWCFHPADVYPDCFRRDRHGRARWRFVPWVWDRVVGPLTWRLRRLLKRTPDAGDGGGR